MSLAAEQSVEAFDEPGDDDDRATAAVLELLEAVGAEIDGVDAREGAARLVALSRQLLEPAGVDLAGFENDTGYDGLVVVRGVGFVSICSCHLLPYSGRAHVAYLPGRCIIGLSKLAGVVEQRARAIQAPERLARRVVDCIDELLEPAGSGVIVEGQSGCGDSLGERCRQTTVSVRGRLRDDPALRREFLTLCGYPIGR